MSWHSNTNCKSTGHTSSRCWHNKAAGRPLRIGPAALEFPTPEPAVVRMIAAEAVGSRGRLAGRHDGIRGGQCHATTTHPQGRSLAQEAVEADAPGRRQLAAPDQSEEASAGLRTAEMPHLPLRQVGRARTHAAGTDRRVQVPGRRRVLSGPEMPIAPAPASRPGSGRSVGASVGTVTHREYFSGVAGRSQDVAQDEAAGRSSWIGPAASRIPALEPAVGRIIAAVGGRVKGGRTGRLRVPFGMVPRSRVRVATDRVRITHPINADRPDLGISAGVGAIGRSDFVSSGDYPGRGRRGQGGLAQ
jgi:hypothetical protein